MFELFTVEKKVPVTVIKKVTYPVHVPGKWKNEQIIRLSLTKNLSIYFLSNLLVERPYPVHVDNPVPCKYFNLLIGLVYIFIFTIPLDSLSNIQVVTYDFKNTYACGNLNFISHNGR